MALIQTVHLSMANFKSAPVVPAVQNDTDRQVKMIVDDFDLTSGMTGKIAFQRSDGTHYETSATLNTSDNSFTADIDQALTQPGRTMVQLKVTDTLTVSTFSFVIFVEQDNSGTVTPQEGIDLVSAVQAAEDAADRAEAAAETLELDDTLTESGKAADAKAVGDAIGEVVAEVTDLTSACDEQKSIIALIDQVPIPFQFITTGYYVRFSTGELTSSSSYCATDYVDISAYKSINYKKTASTSSAPTMGIAFYDANKVYISGIRAKNNESSIGYYGMETVDKPANCVYARFTGLVDTVTYGVFELYGTSIIKSKFDDVDDELSDLSDDLSDLSIDISELSDEVEGLINKDNVYLDPTTISYEPGGMFTTGTANNSGSATSTTVRNVVNDNNPAPYALIGSSISCDEGYTLRLCIYSVSTGVGGSNLIKYIDGDGNTPINIDTSGYCRWSIKSASSIDTSDPTVVAELLTHLHLNIITSQSNGRLLQAEIDIENLEYVANDYSALVAAQTKVAGDWHFPLINVWQYMGLGSNHQIPGTSTLWDVSGAKSLTQRQVWMSDGVHPFRGAGVTPMYARTIAKQMEMITPSYRDSQGETDTDPADWTGRTLLWMGTSIPAGSDPDAGSGTGATYPAQVATALGATCINRARGGSCLRINSSTGEYTGMIFGHFLRAVTRTIAECDIIAENWESLYPKISGAPTTLTESEIATMKSHSFENLLLSYMNGTETVPDLWVIDYGHNDVRPKDIDGNQDTYMEPTIENIENGLLAEDTFMSNNQYANLKIALNNDLSGINDVSAFAASVNRNCFKGAMNFLIMLILRYNPYARIVIVTDYD